MVSPDSQAPACPPSGRNSTYRPVQISGAAAADGIRVNAIAPGAIPGGGFDADTKALERMIPLGRTGTPDDIADMAVALLCDRFSRYVTGTTVAVDGGLSLYNWIPFRTLG
jgi:NAD(P)-dependent dehydrogenase (short-subunit alcohol dehydrogenase family)